MLTVACAVAAIDWLPGSGEPVAARTAADLAYHANTDDHHWFGTDRWAVFFDLDTWFIGVDSLRFAADEAVLYFPVGLATDAATVRLYADNASHQPGEELASASLSGDLSGWQTFTLSQTATGGALWLVLDYTTAEDGGWVSASVGDGEHSWWWDPDYGSDGCFRNFAANGYSSEFLFGLNGQFLFPEDVVDAELLDIAIDGDVYQDEEVPVSFKMRNNAAVSQERLRFRAVLSYASTTEAPNDTITVSQIDIAPHAVYEDVTGESFPLIHQPCQYQLTGSVVDEDITGLATNNTISLRFDTFEDSLQYVFVENALYSDWSEVGEWWDVERQLLDDDKYYILNIFPDAADTLLHRQASAWRYGMLQLMSTPAAVVQSHHKVLGYLGETAFSDSLQATVARAADHTFFKLESMSASTWNGTNITATLSFINTHTHVMSSYLSEIRLHAVIAQRGVSTLQGDVPGAVLISRLTPIAGMPVETLLHESSQAFEINYSPNALPTISPLCTLEQLDLVYWFDNSDGGRVLQTGVIPLSELDEILVSVGEEPEAPSSPMVTLHPNPFTGSSPLRIQFSRSQAPDAVQVDIYNVRGRRVRRIEPDPSAVIEWDGRDNRRNLCASGVYLVKVTTRRGDDVSRSVHRCLLLK